jgi:hypothetical protein
VLSSSSSLSRGHHKVADVGEDSFGLFSGQVFAVPGEVDQEPRHDTGQTVGAVQPARADEPSFAIAEPYRFAGQREDPHVPVAVEQPLERPGRLVEDAIAGAQHYLPAVLADPAGSAGHHRDLEVGVVGLADQTRGAADVLPGGLHVGHQ